MQIDFHHTVTYVVARWAGFNQEQAEKIAYAAQYVDDATNSGRIEFNNGALYERTSTAHKMIDLNNFDKLKDSLVWLPFHFLPGNEGLSNNDNSKNKVINRLLCRPNSCVAHDMLESCIYSKSTHPSQAIHRLGITAHVYVDTWAHQDFAGIEHKINDVEDVDADENDETFLEELASFAVGELAPLGHGSVLTFPDIPWLSWSYTKKGGTAKKRNNTDIFIEAADNLYNFFCAWINDDVRISNIVYLSEKRKSILRKQFLSVKSECPDKRHESWLRAIAKGEIPDLGCEKITYIPKGKGSWKALALGTYKPIDLLGYKYPWSNDFMTSNWKMFHDAAKAHRVTIIDNILPRYGICAA
jgi:hypothetical protein